MEDVSLRIGDTVFKANKEVLCEYSDYFRAMFCGHYVESGKQEINIDMLDPNIMSIILKYMKLGMILLSEYPLSTIGEIAVAANFLQIIELIKQIQYVLDIQLSESNWLETMEIAQNAAYSQLEQYSAAYGLYSFKSMKPEYIPTIQNLVWYLCHPYLDSQNEMHVFKLGFKWLIMNHKLEHILLIFACLDMKRVTNKNLIDMKEYLSDYVDRFSDSLILEIIDCLLELTSEDVAISELSLNEHKTKICSKFSECVWSEIMSIVKHSRARLLKYVPVVPCFTLKDLRPDFSAHSLYTFDEDKGFEQYLEVAEKKLWGWNIAAWGLTKLVVVGGEHGRGSGIFMRDIKVYDTLRKKWTVFGVQLPPRRHAGVTTLGNLLYIVGGVGEFRVVLETAVVYDLKELSFRKIANLPDAIQSPAVCTHNNNVYMAGHKNIYRYETNDDNKDYWKMVVDSNIRISFMKSYNNYIYCMQNYFRALYRFRPGEDEHLHYVASFSNAPGAMCNYSGDCLTVFTQNECLDLTVESITGEVEDEKPRIITKKPEKIKVNDTAGSCYLVMSMPPLCTELPQYHRQYLARHTNTSLE